MSSVELRHLRYYVAVAEELHFGRAAERLHMAQLPLSQQIRQLEAELGVDLLERTTRRVDLTAAGTAYLTRARAILAAVDDAGDEAQRVAAGLEGRLVVGCVGSATYTLLPDLARTLQAELPGVEVTFRGEMLSSDQVSALLDGGLDLGLLRPPVDEPALLVQPLRRDPLLVAVPTGHRYASRKRLRVADLRDEGLIVHSAGRSVMHSTVLALCAEAGFPARVSHEVAETSTLVTFVAAGLDLAVVPAPVAGLGVAGVVHVPLAGASGVELAAATRAEEDAPHLARALAILADLTARSRPSSDRTRHRVRPALGPLRATQDS